MTASTNASPPDNSSLTAIIVAAGGGARMGGGLEKQFRDFGGRAVLAYSVDAFLRHPATGRIVVVVAEGRQQAAQDALGPLADEDGWRSPPAAPGGRIRCAPGWQPPTVTPGLSPSMMRRARFSRSR